MKIRLSILSLFFAVTGAFITPITNAAETTSAPRDTKQLKIASGSALLMDAALQCFDAHGQFLGALDDAATRDPILNVTPVADGPVFLCVSDAHDKGGAWHSYWLSLEEVK